MIVVAVAKSAQLFSSWLPGDARLTTSSVFYGSLSVNLGAFYYSEPFRYE
jgi:hypothetical protein